MEEEGKRPPEECHESPSSPKGPSNMKCSIRPSGTGRAVNARYVLFNCAGCDSLPPSVTNRGDDELCSAPSEVSTAASPFPSSRALNSLMWKNEVGNELLPSLSAPWYNHLPVGFFVSRQYQEARGPGVETVAGLKPRQAQSTRSAARDLLE